MSDADTTAADEPKSEKADAKKATGEGPKKRGKWRRRLLIALGIFVVSIPLLWIAIHRIPGFGPLMADTGRAILGNDAIAWLEEVAYGAQDRINRTVRSGEEPAAYWSVPSGDAEVPTAPSADAGVEWSLPTFSPTKLAPMHESFSAPGDGQWVAMPDPRRPDDPPRMYKTLLHPDANRSWSAVMIVAVDLRTVDVHSVPGRYEPKANTEEGKGIERPATIDAKQHEALLAAFNGGYKTTHGKFGMYVDGVTVVTPKKKVCTVALTEDGSLRIGSWETLEGQSFLFYRQTPPCLYENHKLHIGLTVKDNLDFGATIDGNTVIRRSAIAVSEDGQILYVGIGDHTTANGIADAMHHTGAPTIAQLDVNWSYPKFVTYEPHEDGSGKLMAKALVEGFEYTEDEYIRDRAPRDFFYLTRKPPEAIRAKLEKLTPPSPDDD